MRTNIFSSSIKNWDNKTWLSSPSYIHFFNKFLIYNAKLTQSSKILDIGCGRGNILGDLYSKLKLKTKPLGLDVEDHDDKDRRINFKKIDAINFLKKNNKDFDLILIKQTIHLLKINDIKKLLYFCKKKLNYNGRIIIFTLDPHQNQIPTFSLMKKKLTSSLARDKKILKLISKLCPQKIVRKFIFDVEVSKKKYIKMIKNKYISVLLKMSSKKIFKGVDELNLKYGDTIKFKDKLQCIIIKK